MRNKSNSPASYEQKNDFLKSSILATERRRDAVENKASIFLAANGILLAAMTGLGSLISEPLDPSGWVLIGVILLIFALIFIAASSFCAVQVLAPFWFEKRKRVMHLPDCEFNVYWLGKIAQYPNAKVYADAIQPLTAEQLLEQLTNEAYNLSCLMLERYRWIQRAQRAVLISIFFLLGLAALVGLAVGGVIKP